MLVEIKLYKGGLYEEYKWIQLPLSHNDIQILIKYFNAYQGKTHLKETDIIDEYQDFQNCRVFHRFDRKRHVALHCILGQDGYISVPFYYEDICEWDNLYTIRMIQKNDIWRLAS